MAASKLESPEVRGFFAIPVWDGEFYGNFFFTYFWKLQNDSAEEPDWKKKLYERLHEKRKNRRDDSTHSPESLSAARERNYSFSFITKASNFRDDQNFEKLN